MPEEVADFGTGIHYGGVTVMLIDPFESLWLEKLDTALASSPGCMDTHCLLIDGVFVPGLHNSITKAVGSAPHLLFRGLPGFNDRTRDVSPFVLEYPFFNLALKATLQSCSGWPMVSVITTNETCADLAKRLAAWCVVDADGQYLNLRFPDTRRLGDIVSILDETQRASFLGPISAWRVIGRDGIWQEIKLGVPNVAATVEPCLSPSQVVALIECSEADTILSQAWYLNLQPKAVAKSVQYSIIELALAQARKFKLGEHQVDWCHFCFEESVRADTKLVELLFDRWRGEALALIDLESEVK
jgi:hypothetical protein